MLFQTHSKHYKALYLRLFPTWKLKVPYINFNNSFFYVSRQAWVYGDRPRDYVSTYNIGWIRTLLRNSVLLKFLLQNIKRHIDCNDRLLAC